ncbi:DUF3047 domain-containing protein [Zeimonas arvi]|uniref:DUF3047 domain-containing protein n=2 Tax=Zeimonas arvi TaxID=2498847 RepID=A0A5C8P6S1_9BURK|nr:DUF3047 domain-containing protein [Zeimonas arvi]
MLLAAGIPCGIARAASPGTAAEPVAWVGRFAQDHDAWREVRLEPDLTPNEFQYREWDGVQALEVRSASSMSLMARPLDVDLKATPVLCWRWRVAASIAEADMRQRQGDDYAARVYVSFELPDATMSFGLKARLALARAVWGPDLPDAAVNYVWDNRNPPGTEQANAYTDRAMMVVLRTGDAEAGQWVWERRNVNTDVSRLFVPGARAVQLAVTADTDNTGTSAHAGFADFHFVQEGSPCRAPS